MNDGFRAVQFFKVKTVVRQENLDPAWQVAAIAADYSLEAVVGNGERLCVKTIFKFHKWN